MITFGERFKKLRLEKNLTQENLIKYFNKKYNMSYRIASISQYENNKRRPELKQLEAWADFFDVSIDYLLGRSNIRNYNEHNTCNDYRIQALSDESKKQLDNFIKYLIFQENNIE